MKVYIYIAALLALLAALGGAGWYVHTSAINKVRVELVEQHAKDLKRAVDISILLQDKKDKALEDLQKRLRTNDTRIKQLNRELLNRPQRSDPVTSETGNSCTGARLYRDDAEFLTWYSAQTERLREERDYYYERYEHARKELERLKNGKD